MASSLISNSHHIDFESVFRLDDAGMVQMFETLIATRLKEFLGCPAVFYEDALTEFFANSSVREDGMVVSTIGGTAIEISQAMFAAAFEFPTEGLIDLTYVPKNFVFDARSLFSDSKEQVSMSCLKKALKFHYRLLHDILAKTIYVKAGSFDCVTRDRFLLMTAITFDVKINWSSLLFGVFKEMRIHESTCEIRSKVNDVEFSVRGDLLKQQAWLRQTFQNACEVLERQSTQMNDLKKGLMAPVGTILQDLFDIKKNQRAQEAKLNALDGQVDAIRNEQLEFQNKISADLLSLSTQFADIVDYIRGGDAKKGEGGSRSRPTPVRVERRPLPTPQ
ncbi:hypothetical protein F511_42783 [Dorcoceras hygrometricum]|uniref:Dystroglycan-like n=1 Tax=Dorcoceras hygrometricum TaxID=472368 RepID=A0A2Z7BWK9_9LAMI|nr:hypothetical protein F511_42783 [Dorcoceras hygrometricum]